jgi:hypothetical protein
MERQEGENGGGAELRVEEASRVIKEYASKQPVRVQLTDEQLRAIVEQWGKGDLRRPAEITFYLEERPVGQLRMASCGYLADTCCA